jgi:Prenyltransferase and squalene oxidase repeat
MNSEAAPSNSPARSTRSAQVAASPTNISSPATAQTNPGPAAATPEAARTAMTRSLNGVSGVGQAANLDRALEAAESPAMVASGSARRAEATQNTPEGAALAPSAPALVRHSLAGADRPSASVRATTTEAATLAGSQQPAELTASASGALTQANANAATGTVTAAAGQVQVDLGPTRVVSGGGASRAAGGGQPELNLSAEAKQLARNSSGGTPQPTLTSDAIATEAVAPAGSGGGQPTPQGIAPTLADVGRGEPSPTEIGSGAAPSSKTEPADTPAAAESLAGGTPTRADSGSRLPQVAAVDGAASDEEEDDEEERARRLARQAIGGAPQIAVRAEVAPGMAGGSSGQPAGAEAATGAEAAEGQLARAETGEGAPTATGSVGAPGDMKAASGGGDLAGPIVVRRAEATDGFTGTPEPGGGTNSPNKASPTRSFTANMSAAVATVAGSPNSGGSPSGSPVDTTGIRAAELTSGRSGSPAATSVGAKAGRQSIEGVADAGAIAGLASQARSATSSEGPSVGNELSSASPMRRATVGPTGLSGNVAAVEVPSAPSTTAIASVDTGDAGMGSDLGPMARQASASVPIEIGAIDGPGGLGRVEAADVGVNNRRARADSLQIQSRTTRFVRQEVGGVPNFSTAAVVSADAYRGRGKPGDSPGSMGSPAGQQSDKAIELGLAYLARQQLPDGSWNLQAVDHRAVLVSDTAATGLALLAFQGYGYTHHDNKYAAVVKRAIDYLVNHQRDDGDLFIPLDDESNRSVWLYSHGIAALAMSEAYGMTQDPELKEPAQKAIDFIVAGQHKEYGGWRYAPGIESDTSVTGWMMMALKSGDLANLEVPTETYARIEHWLDSSQGSRSERHKYRYNPHAPDTETQRHGRDTSQTMTAVGLLMRFYTGWRRDHENMVRGADYLLESPPAIGTTRVPKRDTYYWYYATQVMFHMGGERWKKWNDQLRPVLLDGQIQTGAEAGSWNPRLPVADRWAPHAGRLYVTTMNLLSLEVHYRHLPLYDETGR